MVSLLLSAALSVLSPLTLSQELDVIEGYGTHVFCQQYLTQDAEIYLRELVFEASQRKPEVRDFFAGVHAAAMQHQIKYVYDRNYCINALPKAFAQVEAIKLIK
jgi:hypothetical protein